MISTAEALTGRWAANVPGWAVSTILASAIVVSQELSAESENGVWIAASVLLQTIAVTSWAVLVASIARLLTGRVPPVALAALWLGIGALRGIIGALVAIDAGAPPEWGYRIAFWTVVTLVWMPLLTYALAQWDEHRRLLAERAALIVALDLATMHAVESDAARTRRLAAAADDALGPGLDEIRAALRALGASDEVHAAGDIAGRLEALTMRAAEFTAPASIPPPPRAARRVSVDTASREFELRRPIAAAFLTAASSAPILLPEAYRDGGWWSVAEMAVAILVSTGLLTAAFGILRPWRFTGAQRSIGSRIGVVLAGIAGAATLLALTWDDEAPVDLLLTLLVPLVLTTAASTTATAVALAATNVDLADGVHRDRAALAEIRAHVLDAEAEAAARVETLVRGDLNGRLASCAMALGFLVNGDVEPESQPRVVRGVLDQLDAAAAELHARVSARFGNL